MWWYGEAADGSKRDLKINNWFCSLSTGPTASRLILALGRICFWGGLCGRLLWRALPSTISDGLDNRPDQGELLLSAHGKYLLRNLVFFLPACYCFLSAARPSPELFKVRARTRA